MQIRIGRLIVLAAAIACTSASAQNFPTKPLRMVVGFIKASGAMLD